MRVERIGVMKFNIRGSKIEITDSIKNYIETRIGKVEKYLNDSSDVVANVLVKVHSKDQKVEVTIPLKKVILRSEEVHKDLYAAIDLVADKLERQIIKNKTRIKRKDSIKQFVEFEANAEDDDKTEIIKRKTVELKPMNEEEAILQMNLLGHEFFVFENSETNLNSILYRRKDGNYGLIELK